MYSVSSREQNMGMEHWWNDNNGTSVANQLSFLHTLMSECVVMFTTIPWHVRDLSGLTVWYQKVHTARKLHSETEKSYIWWKSLKILPLQGFSSLSFYIPLNDLCIYTFINYVRYVLGYCPSDTLAVPTVAAQAPKSENKVPCFIPMKVILLHAVTLLYFRMLFVLQGGKLVYPCRQNTFAYQRSRMMAIMLNKWTMEEVQSLLNPECGYPTWAVRVCGQAEFLIWSVLLPL